MTDVFPKNHKPEKAGNRDTSLFTKFAQGDNKVRVLSEATIGYVWWVDRKPNRCKDLDEIPDGVAKGGKDGWKEFYAFKVYNLTEQTVQLMEITQSTIKGALFDLNNSDEWGDIRSYNINIRRSGEGKETEYTVMPSPKSELTPAQLESVERVKLDWKKHFAGEPPFIFPDKKDEEVDPSDVPF